MSKWDRPGIPHKGWRCVDVYDEGAPDRICEMCEHQRIRFVHVMEHDDHSEALECGRDCAEKMGEEYAKEREKPLRQKADRHKRRLAATAEDRIKFKLDPDHYAAKVAKRIEAAKKDGHDTAPHEAVRDEIKAYMRACLAADRPRQAKRRAADLAATKADRADLSRWDIAALRHKQAVVAERIKNAANKAPHKALQAEILAAIDAGRERRSAERLAATEADREKLRAGRDPQELRYFISHRIREAEQDGDDTAPHEALRDEINRAETKQAAIERVQGIDWLRSKKGGPYMNVFGWRFHIYPCGESFKASRVEIETDDYRGGTRLYGTESEAKKAVREFILKRVHSGEWS